MIIIIIINVLIAPWIIIIIITTELSRKLAGTFSGFLSATKLHTCLQLVVCQLSSTVIGL